LLQWTQQAMNYNGYKHHHTPSYVQTID
jgi:hypothetical protein